jgi:hypothetical protein
VGVHHVVHRCRQPGQELSVTAPQRVGKIWAFLNQGPEQNAQLVVAFDCLQPLAAILVVKAADRRCLCGFQLQVQCRSQWTHPLASLQG